MHTENETSIVDAIDAVLPQLQCRRCGYDACRPYAQAVAQGEAIDRCAPAGDTGIAALAKVTGRPAVQLPPAVGRTQALMRAEIDDQTCIGCTLCIEACPVDAIAGAPKRMHAVVAAWCTGCELCVPACPVDCIRLVAAARRWSDADAQAARERYDERRGRRGTPAPYVGIAAAGESPRAAPSRVLSREERAAAVVSALQRARARRGVRA